MLIDVGTAVQAQEYRSPVVYERVPSTEELIESLTPDESIRLRGIRPVEPAAQPVVALPVVQFKFDSYQLLPEAKKALNNLGPALNSDQLINYGFRIEGHTDAIGSYEYNQRLSEDRAQAVKEYLVRNFGVDTDRLVTVGHGETVLLNREDPSAAVNRRVQVVTLEKE